MGNNNKPIEGSPINTTTGIAAPAPTPSYSYSPTTTFTTTSTTTSIPSITSSKAASTTTKLILTPAIKPLNKQVRVNTVKKDPIAASTSSKPPTKKTWRKKAVEGEDPSKKP